MPPIPVCETTGLINLCPPAAVINAPSWLYLSLPNIIWYLAVLLLLVLGIFLPFPADEVDTTGYDSIEGA